MKTRLTGICGSDTKWCSWTSATTSATAPPIGYFSFPTVFGHEVVGDVVEIEAPRRTLEVGQRVVLNPWLSCGPRGIDPPCPSCLAGDYSLCWHFTEGPIAAGIHTGTSKDAPGGFAEYLPAHESMLIPVPDSVSDEVAVIGDPFAVSLHSVTRHPPPPGGKAFVYGGGALGSTATAILRALYPDVDVMVNGAVPGSKGASRSGWAQPWSIPFRWSNCSKSQRNGPAECSSASGTIPCRWPTPGGIDVVYDTVGTAQTGRRSACRLLKARGTMVKSGVHAPERWEWSPLYFTEIAWVGSNAFGVEEVDGIRRHGIEHYLRVAWSKVGLTSRGCSPTPFDSISGARHSRSWPTRRRSGAIKVAFDFR